MAAPKQQQLSVSLQIAYLEALIALMCFYLLLQALYQFIRKFIPKGFGAAGAFTWGFSLLLACAGLFGFAALSPWVLPILACVVGLAVFLSIIFKAPTAGLLYQLREFLLKVCGPAGAIYFALTFICLASGLAIPLSIMFAASGFVALLAMIECYTGDKKNSELHCFVSRVLGSGGATFWFLEFLIFTGVAISAPVMIIIPVAVMLIALGLWYRAHKDSDLLTKPCFSCYPELRKGQARTTNTVAVQEESEKSHQAGSITSRL